MILKAILTFDSWFLCLLTLFKLILLGTKCFLKLLAETKPSKSAQTRKIKSTFQFL